MTETDRQNAIYKEARALHTECVSWERAFNVLRIQRLDMLRESIDRVAVQLEKLDPLREDPNLDSFGNPIKKHERQTVDDWE